MQDFSGIQTEKTVIKLLLEAGIELATDQTIGQWMAALQKAVSAAVVNVLPAASPDERGHYPYQSVHLLDATAEYALVRAYRYGTGEADSFSRSYKVGYVTSGGEVTAGEVQEVEAKVSWQAVSDVVADEAVDDPKVSQRKNLPPAAYAAPFYEGQDGTYEPGGKFSPSKSLFPHHVGTAKTAAENDSADLPRLRRAMAKFSQGDFSRFGESKAKVRTSARRHLAAHAKALLKSNLAEEGPTLLHVESLLEEDLDLMIDEEFLCVLTMLKSSNWLAEGKALGVELLADISGEHPHAARLGIALSEARNRAANP